MMCVSQAGLAQASRPADIASPSPDLARAIASMRHIDASKLTDLQREKMGAVVDAAWKTIRASGPGGLAALKQELRKIGQAGEKDDFFKLSAAALMWDAWSFDAADTIAEAFRTTHLSAQSDYMFYMFYTAFFAAKTQDERAVPILKATLHNDKLEVFVAEHYMQIVWPLAQQFIWGCYGSKGLPELTKVLDESKNPVELQTATFLLARAQYLPALPRIRQLARQGDPAVAAMAIRALGIFGHPEDYEFLAAGLRSTDPRLLNAYAYAAWEYGDLQMVSLLIPLLENNDAQAARQAAEALWQLVDPMALDAIAAYARKHQGEQRAKICRQAMDKFVSTAKMTYEDYSAKLPAEKARILADLRAGREAEFKLQDGDRRLTHEQFLRAAEGWKKAHRITGGEYAWVEDRHVMDVATAADLPILFDVRAAVLGRLSDECLPESDTLLRLIERIGRARYRRVVGVTEQAELATDPQAGATSQPATGP
jgi:HEAT repeat protein